MEILVIVLAATASLFTAFAFYKAGKFKAFSTKETLLGAGFGWVEKTPFGAVRLIAWLELLGAAGWRRQRLLPRPPVNTATGARRRPGTAGPTPARPFGANLNPSSGVCPWTRSRRFGCGFSLSRRSSSRCLWTSWCCASKVRGRRSPSRST